MKVNNYNKFIPGLILIVLLFAGCGQVKNLFQGASPHEKYLRMLEQTGLDKTELGKAWKDTSETSLFSPIQIKLPFKEEIYFFNNRAEANTYKFSAKKGELITVGISHNSPNDHQIFIDLFLEEPGNKKEFKRITSSDSTGIMQHEIDENGNYLLRIQPELLTGGKVTLTILTAPSLAFPIPGKNSYAIKSVFGDPRDVGTRLHQGDDIFAKRGTPVTSVSNGIVSRVQNTKIGGKVVWVYNVSEGENIYYAHLDSQFVSTGKIVKTGDTLGLVGNTGNAGTTPTHLHFGIYLPMQGAVDPFPYINNIRPAPKAIDLNSNMLGRFGRIKSNHVYVKTSLMKNAEAVTSLGKNTPVEIIGESEDSYFIRTPFGEKGFIKSSFVEDMGKPLKTVKLKRTLNLYDSPLISGTVISPLNADNTIEIYGKLGNYQFVRNRDYFGWIMNL